MKLNNDRDCFGDEITLNKNINIKYFLFLFTFKTLCIIVCFQNIYVFIVALYFFLKATIFFKFPKISINKGRNSLEKFGIYLYIYILYSYYKDFHIFPDYS